MTDLTEAAAFAVLEAQNAQDCFDEEQQLLVMAQGAGVLEEELLAAAAEWRRRAEEVHLVSVWEYLPDVDDATLARLIAFPCMPVRRMAVAELADRRRKR